MTVVTEIYEVTGPTGSPVSTAVDNLNFKSSKALTDEYFYFPMRRPNTIHDDLTYSYYKTFYFTLNSTTSVKNLKINVMSVDTQDVIFDGATDDATGSQLFYKFTNTYVEPVDMHGLHSGTYMTDYPTALTLFPFVSSSSPNAATSRIITLSPNVTYYTNYLVMQMRVPYGDQTVKNGKSFGIQFTFDSF